MTDVANPTIVADLKRCAADLRRTDRDVEKLTARRNGLWRKAIESGMTAAEIGKIFGLEAQTIRWNLKQIEAGATPKPRKARQRGLKAGGRK